MALFMSAASLRAAARVALFSNLPPLVTEHWHAINLSHDQQNQIGPMVRDFLVEVQNEIAREVRRNKPQLVGQFQVPDLTYRSSRPILSTSCYIVHRLNAT